MQYQDQVLLVAGVAASGKSSFIEAVRSGRIEPAIMENLPDGAGRWPLLRNHEMRRIGGRRRQANSIVHLDLTWRMSPQDEHDPKTVRTRLTPPLDQHPARPLLDSSDVVHIVIVRPTLADLLGQLERRVVLGAMPARLRKLVPQNDASPMASAMMNVAHMFHHANLGVFGDVAAPAKRLERLRAAYEMPGLLDHVYEAWDAYFIDLLGSKLAAPPLVVAPCRDLAYGGRCGFQRVDGRTRSALSKVERVEISNFAQHSAGHGQRVGPATEISSEKFHYAKTAGSLVTR